MRRQYENDSDGAIRNLNIALSVLKVIYVILLFVTFLLANLL